MPDRRRRRCKVCHGHESEVGQISWRGLCLADAHDRLNANNDQLHAHSGPWFEHWRAGSLRALGVGVFDERGLSAHTAGHDA